MTTAIRTDKSFTKKMDIFCIEGRWNNNHSSLLSVFNALEFLKCVAGVNKILKQCLNEGTLKELVEDSMQKQYKKYSILYFAFHGKSGAICVGKRNQPITLDEISDMIGDKANGKIIHFGCCSTLNIGKWEINRFLKNTNALAVSGYKNDIDFLESTVFDLIYFQQCQQTYSMKAIEKYMKNYHHKLGKELGFVIHKRS